MYSELIIWEEITMKSLGNHLLIELYSCDAKIINDQDKVEKILNEAVKISGATALQSIFHKFSPHGVSGIIVIAESHFSIHTWPEYGYCAVDIFTCGEKIDNYKALDLMKKGFKTNNISVIESKRGILDMPIEKIKHKPGG